MQVPSVDRINSTAAWRTQGADLYSTGASGAVPVRPVNPVTPVESVDKLGEGATARTADPARTPDKPVATDQGNRDWTTSDAQKTQAAEKEKNEPPKEPISKQLMEFVQSMWRASTMAVDLADTTSKATLQERLAQQVKNDQSPVYSAPTVKRTGG